MINKELNAAFLGKVFKQPGTTKIVAIIKVYALYKSNYGLNSLSCRVMNLRSGEKYTYCSNIKDLKFL